MQKNYTQNSQLPIMKLLNPKYLIASLAIFCCLSIQKAKAQVNTQDSLALVDLYDSTGGANWKNCIPWKLSKPVSQWNGITILGGRVTSIVLKTLGLRGSIPPSIGNLTKLTTLNLWFNSLNNSIPTSIGNLKSLTTLDLSVNQLTGAIPSSIGNLTNLTLLDLSQNKLSDSIPTSLGNLNNLTDLELWRNKLSGPIPSTLGNLSSAPIPFST